MTFAFTKTTTGKTKKATRRAGSLPRYRKPQQGTSADVNPGLHDLVDIWLASDTAPSEEAEKKFFKLVAAQLRLLSSPLWTSVAEPQTATRGAVVEEFRVPDIRAQVRAAIVRAERKDAYARTWAQSDRCSDKRYFVVDLDLFLGLQATDWVSSRDGVIWASSYHEPRFFALDDVQSVQACVFMPEAWIDEHRNLRRKHEEATARLSAGQTDRSNLASKEQDPIGRKVEAEFHLRLIERRIEQTLTSNETLHVQ